MKFSLKSFALFCISLFVLAAAITSFAQTFSSSIAGVITDPSGSVVQGAKVHLRNMGTSDVRDTTTTTAGLYKFDNLLPGTYEIRAEAPGFKTYVQSNMILRASTAATVNIPFTIGAAEQSVQVTSEAVLVDTESANNTVTMDNHLIESLPNSYRNPLNFVFALAGTTEAQSGQTTRSGSFDQNGSQFGLNGGRTGNEQILIDGAPSTAVDWGGLFVAPNADSVQEQQVATNVYDAQYERSGAGVVTLITKSGSNSFHGEVYDYMRNSA
ncbi:MAG TPA: carboxypeptidase-like regulatory domain-containing protein, partial [Terriglobales bacterium]|nr:carboxypeptidase-like regulatory domain-containing protein [Terriglobales bacterium]